MINALQSVDQSLTLIVPEIVPEDIEPVEPPAKRPRVSAESAADEPLVIPEPDEVVLERERQNQVLNEHT